MKGHGTRTSHLLVVSLLIAVLCAVAPASAAPTTYSSAWSGGTIAPGESVILADGASLTGNVEANGRLEFAQTTTLTTSAAISGTGSLAVTNTGTVVLTGLTSGTARFDLAISASRGELAIGATGTSPLVVGNTGVGSLSVTGGTVKNGLGFLGFTAGSLGTATVSSGTWANAAGSGGRTLNVGYSGTGVLDVAGGFVTNASGILGGLAGGVGTATVSSGTWQNRGPLYVGGNAGGNGGTGTLTMTGGRVTSTLSLIGANSAGVGTVTVTGGTWSNAANLNVGSSGTGTLTISGSGGAGGTVIVGGTLSKGASGTINLEAGGTLQIGTGSTGGVLATDLVNNGALVFDRLGTGTVGVNISGTGSVTLANSATIRITGTSNYSGPTTINAGTLLVDGALGSTNVVVNAGGSLGGSGVLGGAVAVQAGGTMAPGSGLESLACGPLTLRDGAVFRYEWDSQSPARSDLLTILGDLFLTGSVGLVLDDLAATSGTVAEGTILSLMTYSGSWTGGSFSRSGASLADESLFSIGDQLWRIDYDATAGGVNRTAEYLPDGRFVNLVAVPEPSAGVLLGIGLLGPALTWRRARRRQGAENLAFRRQIPHVCP
jgi:fibronectin-binding autotransporter adhesin